MKRPPHCASARLVSDLALQDEYRFLLCHEPDAFVFRDEVEQWCDSGDYIGAPWFSGCTTYPEDAHIVGVGNSGFSLRNIDAHGRANRTVKLLQTPGEVWSQSAIVQSPLDSPACQRLPVLDPADGEGSPMVLGG